MGSGLELFSRIETLRAELYWAAGGSYDSMDQNRILQLSSELDQYLVLATRKLSGLL